MATAAIAAANGGYFATDYGWAALGFLAVTATAVLVVDDVELGRLDWALLAALGGFTAWVAISAVWSTSLAQPLLETERAVLYLAAAGSLLVVVRRSTAAAFLGGVTAGVVAVAAYALATRLVPDAPGIGRPADAGASLAGPLGYANALGILVVLAMLLAIGFAVNAPRPAARAASAGSLGVLAPTLFFTYSRGAWLALVAGAAAVLALHPARLRFAGSAAVVAAPAAVGIWASSRARAAIETGAAGADGHRLAGWLAALVVCSAAVGLAIPTLERRVLQAAWRRYAVAVTALAAAVAVAVVVAARGSGSSSFRTDYWRVAASEYAEHPWLGTGAGSFERVWLERRPVNFFSRDAHSLYIESLMEYGPVGLLLLVGLLCVPLLALRSVRRRPYAPAAAGAYAAFLVHAGLDWDLEMPAIALAGLSCGIALVAWGRRAAPRRVRTSHRVAGLALVAVLTAFVAVMHVGNSALAASAEALAAGDHGAAAEHARKASRWAPWSHEPWQSLGDAQLSAGATAAARSSFRSAIARDSRNWRLWVDLAVASRGDERRRALDAALRLNPFSAEARELRAAP